MKVYRNVLNSVWLLSCMLCFSSCNQQDEKLTNWLIIDGKTKVLGHGYFSDEGIVNDDHGAEGRQYNIHLTTLALKINASNEYEGYGSGIQLQLLSKSITSLEAGEYKVEVGDYLLGKAYGIIAENYDSATGTSENSYYLQSGQVTVSRNKDCYRIEFELTLKELFSTNEVIASGRFEGLLKELQL